MRWRTDAGLKERHTHRLSRIRRSDDLFAKAGYALSGNAIPRDIEKGLEAGFFRYLTKPIKVNEFMEILDVALEFAKTQPAGANSGEKV